MDKSILITGQNEFIQGTVVNIFLNSGYKVLTTVPMEAGKEPVENLFTIRWNPRSPLSARNTILEATSKTDKVIDEIIVLLPFARISSPLHETTAPDIEKTIDFHIKGSIFIIKESLSHLQNTNGGTLSIIQYLPGAEISPPLESLEQGSFSGLIKSLFAYYQNEKISINAFTSSTTEIKDYAGYIFKIISERQKIIHGKFYKYSDKNVLSALGLSSKR